MWVRHIPLDGDHSPLITYMLVTQTGWLKVFERGDIALTYDVHVKGKLSENTCSEHHDVMCG